MEVIQRKYDNFSRAYNALQRSIKILKNLPPDTPTDLHDVIVAGVIKHFELAFEMCWKFLKVYLEVKLQINTTGSKDIFRMCYKYQILSLETTDALLELIEDRNLTVHIYDQATALEICQEIEKRCGAFDKVIELNP